jgi:hypothetical protein
MEYFLPKHVWNCSSTRKYFLEFLMLHPCGETRLYSPFQELTDYCCHNLLQLNKLLAPFYTCCLSIKHDVRKAWMARYYIFYEVQKKSYKKKKKRGQCVWTYGFEIYVSTLLSPGALLRNAENAKPTDNIYSPNKNSKHPPLNFNPFPSETNTHVLFQPNFVKNKIWLLSLSLWAIAVQWSTVSVQQEEYTVYEEGGVREILVQKFLLLMQR